MKKIIVVSVHPDDETLDIGRSLLISITGKEKLLVKRYIAKLRKNFYFL